MEDTLFVLFGVCPVLAGLLLIARALAPRLTQSRWHRPRARLSRFSSFAFGVASILFGTGMIGAGFDHAPNEAVFGLALVIAVLSLFSSGDGEPRSVEKSESC